MKTVRNIHFIDKMKTKLIFLLLFIFPKNIFCYKNYQPNYEEVQNQENSLLVNENNYFQDNEENYNYINTDKSSDGRNNFVKRNTEQDNENKDKSKDLTEYEYHNYDNKDVEDYLEPKMEKRDILNTFHGDISQIKDINKMADDEISMALSILSPDELKTLDNLIRNDNTEEISLVREPRSNRNSMSRDNQDEYDYDDKTVDKRRCEKNCKNMGCAARKIRFRRSNLVEGNQGNRVQHTTSNSTSSPQLNNSFSGNFSSDKKTDLKVFSLGNNIIPVVIKPDEKKTKRNAKNDRKQSWYPSTADRRIQRKIETLREKYKRDSLINNLERESKTKLESRTAMSNQIPYFNSLIDSKVRRKRDSSESNLTKLNPMDDSKSPEHMKLLEESFPNPGSTNSFQCGLPHIRVKRNP